MKTKKILVTLVAVVIVAIASAIEKPTMIFESLSSDQAIFTVINQSEAYFEISILTENDEIVYYKQSDKPLANYQKIFDFKDLENGDYLFKLKVNNVSTGKKFRIRTNKIYMGESKEIIEPHFDFDGKDLKLSFLNTDKENFKIKIYNDYELIYHTKIGNEFALNAGYNLSKLDAGNYKVVLTSNEKEFVYRIEK